MNNYTVSKDVDANLIDPSSGESQVLIGVRGTSCRAKVDAFGSIHLNDGASVVRWAIAGDDRWYDPTIEPSIRQTTRDGLPIVVTKMRVPTGDAVAIAYCTADHGGSIVLEIRNESTLPFAVALSHADFICGRNPANVPIVGVNMPEGSVVYPIGHQASLRFVYVSRASDGEKTSDGEIRNQDLDLSVIASVDKVATGWERALASSTRLNIPDHGLAKAVNRTRCELLLSVGADEAYFENLKAEPIEFVIAINELVRLGERNFGNDNELFVRTALFTDYVSAIEQVLKSAKKPGFFSIALKRLKSAPTPSNISHASDRWVIDHALVGAIYALSELGETRSASDLETSWRRLSVEGEDIASNDLKMNDSVTWSISLQSNLRQLAYVDRIFCRPSRNGGVDVLPNLSAQPWLGANFEVHGLIGPHGKCGYAVRWHGERAALLWEVSQPAMLPITSLKNDPSWRSNQLAGEALLNISAKRDEVAGDQVVDDQVTGDQVVNYEGN